MIFSFSNWDFLYGHFPFHRKEREQLQQYDGATVKELGPAGYYIEKLGIFPIFDRLAVKEYGERDLDGYALRSNQQLYGRYRAIQYKEMMPIPFSFSTPIAILDKPKMDYYLTMGNLCGQDDDGFFEFTLQMEPIKTDLVSRIINDRPLCDGFLRGNDNYMVYYCRIDQLKEEIDFISSIGFKTNVEAPPQIDYSLADKYYSQLFGYTNEGQYRILSDQYESQCKKVIKYIGKLGF